MIPGRFEYHQPDSLNAAVGLLSDLGEDARVIAGGHSLIPMMKLRLAMPEHLVDLKSIDDLKHISVSNGVVRIGAMTTQAELINNAELKLAAPIVKETSLQIADPQVRYQGTIGGNVANGDPGNDMPALMQCLDASYTLLGPDGQREVKARDFYEAAYFTARDDHEILTEISFPVCSGGYAYEKQKRKIGDYATAAAAVLLTRADDGSCAHASIALTNLADTPVFCADASADLMQSGISDTSITAAVQSCLGSIEPVDDNRGPAEFKKHAAAIILKRSLDLAWSRA
ncbi:carbon monoxide dehydrogenase [Chromatiales bacterium (ex Bugula neritina AB1)]|nr:carbon monoxide dehydrogenase [Chromatiales bacterium (ex Bugula neritina AB1)]